MPAAQHQNDNSNHLPSPYRVAGRGLTGRWQVPDPKLQFSSPYVGISNNPASIVDPSGMWGIGGWLRNLFSSISMAGGTGTFDYYYDDPNWNDNAAKAYVDQGAAAEGFLDIIFGSSGIGAGSGGSGGGGGGGNLGGDEVEETGSENGISNDQVLQNDIPRDILEDAFAESFQQVIIEGIVHNPEKDIPKTGEQLIEVLLSSDMLTSDEFDFLLEPRWIVIESLSIDPLTGHNIRLAEKNPEREAFEAPPYVLNPGYQDPIKYGQWEFVIQYRITYFN